MNSSDVEYGSIEGCSGRRNLRKQHSSHWTVKRQESHEALFGVAPAKVHNQFITKVYGLLAAELMATVVVCCIMMFVTPIREAAVSFAMNYALTCQALSLVTLLGSFVFLMCVKDSHPTNIVALSIFVFISSCIVGQVCAVFYAAGMGNLIIISLGITAVMFMSLSVYAWWSEQDFSYMGGFLGAALLANILLGIICMFVHIPALQIVYASCGILIFSGYIVYDTYCLKVKFGPDDAIIASIELYLDIINLFLSILELLASTEKR